MPEATIQFHPDAIREAETAQDWYADQSIVAAHAFVRELIHAVFQVREAPITWPQITKLKQTGQSNT